MWGAGRTGSWVSRPTESGLWVDGQSGSRLKTLTLTTCSRFPLAVGYYIFRGANSQKNTFRKNPSDPRVAGELGF